VFAFALPEVRTVASPRRADHDTAMNRELATTVSRKYPLEPQDEGTNRQGRRRQGWLADDGIAMRLAIAAAEILLDIGEWRRRHADLSQALVAVTFLMLGLGLGGAAAITDSYLHRGVESGAEQPYIVQPTGKSLATNVDLRRYSGDQLVQVATTLADGGFLYVRQEFAWSEIETTRGNFDWSRYDPLVNELERLKIGVIAVVVDTPDWARNIGDSGFANAPPRDPAMLGTFTTGLADRYGSAVPFVQVWEAPNLIDNWGGEVATGASFSPFLEAAWRGTRGGNASARVISPELATTADGVGGLTDLEFLESLYDAGAASFFDIVGISLDGGSYSPDDRRVSATRLNFSRAILFRELMVDRNDGATPIWATSFGWAAGESISRNEQAEYVGRALERSWSEWPWMGLAVQWAFLPPGNSPDSPYAILNPDGTATPLYQRLISQDLRERSTRANTGFTPMDSSAISYTGNWQDQPLEGRTFRTTRQEGASTTIEFQGTGVIVYVRSGPVVGPFTVEIDGKIVPGGSAENDDWWDLSVFSSTDDFPRTLVNELDDGHHTLTITLVGEGELTLGGMEVTRDAPFVWPIVLMTVGSLILLFFGLRSMAYLFATRAGHLRRKSDPDPGPQLPRLTNWRPERRIS